MPGVHRHRVRAAGRFRHVCQTASAALLNGYASGFLHGRVFTGPSKRLCVPVLNCYSCPGALGACPIGALQAVAGGSVHRFPFYVLGTLTLFGIVLGRLVCGFVCPFGWIQDLLYRLPVKKRRVPDRIDRPARYVKYGVLLLPVLLLPLFAVNRYGVSPPYFCEFFCPAGTLEGGVPLLLANEPLRRLAGALFRWKFVVLLAVLTGAAAVSRFFCRYFCPLGAFYALFNRFALYQMRVDQAKCVRCGKCAAVCPMAVAVTEDINSGECIRCGLCAAACPTRAVSGGFDFQTALRQDTEPQ